MTNTQYIEKTIFSVDRILIDTSTLMTRGFQQFISNNKELLLSGDKTIIVPKAVYTELAKHMESADPEKSELAMAAVELMALNKYIFQVESAQLTEEEIALVFADAQLLSELTLHRTDCNQLLITNDRKLSCDAFDLNQQQSCKGCKVLVCYVNWYGELQCCECARPSTVRTICEPISDTPSYNEPPAKEVSQTKEATSVRNTWKFDWLSGLVSVSSLGLIYGIYRGSKELLRNIT